MYYAVFQSGENEKAAEGVIDKTALNKLNRSTMARICELVAEKHGFSNSPIAEVSVNMLARFENSEIYRRASFEPETLPDDDIRFINSNYQELFRIPNGSTITVDYPDRHFSARCEYPDDYHTQINCKIYHICQFAELLERNGGSCRPEPETMYDRAAWKLGTRGFLAIQAEKGGLGYTLYDKSFQNSR